MRAVGYAVGCFRAAFGVKVLQRRQSAAYGFCEPFVVYGFFRPADKPTHAVYRIHDEWGLLQQEAFVTLFTGG
jgi:hypothetical protein